MCIYLKRFVVFVVAMLLLTVFVVHRIVQMLNLCQGRLSDSIFYSVGSFVPERVLEEEFFLKDIDIFSSKVSRMFFFSEIVNRWLVDNIY